MKRRIKQLLTIVRMSCTDTYAVSPGGRVVTAEMCCASIRVGRTLTSARDSYPMLSSRITGRGRHLDPAPLPSGQGHAYTSYQTFRIPRKSRRKAQICPQDAQSPHCGRTEALVLPEKTPVRRHAVSPAISHLRVDRGFLVPCLPRCGRSGWKLPREPGASGARPLPRSSHANGRPAGASLHQ